MRVLQRTYSRTLIYRSKHRNVKTDICRWRAGRSCDLNTPLFLTDVSARQFQEHLAEIYHQCG